MSETRSERIEGDWVAGPLSCEGCGYHVEDEIHVFYVPHIPLRCPACTEMAMFPPRLTQKYNPMTGTHMLIDNVTGLEITRRQGADGPYPRIPVVAPRRG